VAELDDVWSRMRSEAEERERQLAQEYQELEKGRLRLRLQATKMGQPHDAALESYFTAAREKARAQKK
jgi:hypothetical protein